MRITAKFQKAEFDEYATSEVSAFSITSIYLIQISWTKIVITATARLKIGY